MRYGLEILVLAAVFLTVPEIGAARADMAPAMSCSAAGHAAEQQDALPADMLVSIGVVESGRVDAATGRVAAWPWTVNVDGAGHYFQDEPDAAAFVRLAESSGAQDVDVGCFQISLQHHPDAFSSLDAAFDPMTNADFAARFLDGLKAREGSWDGAIADYHSALPAVGLPYAQLVLNAWRGGGGVPPALRMPDFTQADPVVILEGPAARLVRVITMDGAPGPTIAGLPRVITP
jgi:hypothetical protein